MGTVRRLVVLALIVTAVTITGPAAAHAGGRGPERALTATDLDGFLPLAINRQGLMLGIVGANTDFLVLYDGSTAEAVTPALLEGEESLETDPLPETP